MGRASSASQNPRLLSRRDVLVLAAVVALGAAIYLAAAARSHLLGFPLDDSWIHQTYARALARDGEWAFRPGLPSAGSTAPLWSALLAIGFLVGLAPYAWAYLLGAAALLGLTIIMEWAARRLAPAYRPGLPAVGILFAFEWHLLWAAMSGMETILHALVLTLTLVLLMTGTSRFLLLGSLTGLSIWIRPDGVTLLGPVLATILLSRLDTRARWRAASLCMMGLGILLLGYMLFNFALGGGPLPNTFYAKQAEYAAWQARPLLERSAEMSVQLLAGPGVILVPGLAVWLISAARRRDWPVLAAATWCGTYMALYLLRLPAYQHGRYIMPSMPIFFLFGLLGLIEFGAGGLAGALHWRLSIAWRASGLLLWLLFVYIGARSYAADVAVIETEMVDTARWSARHLPADALIAAHDIGALGYFDQHQILDLAGLVSPEVVAFVRNEEQLAAYLNARGADYLIAFPDFYPRLTRDLEVVFVSGGRFSAQYEHASMTVFRWATTK